MSDLDFDKLITEGLTQGPADTAFQARLKQESGHALIKGHQRRLWYRRTGLACVVLLVAVSAFWSGRVTMKPMPPDGPAGFAHHRHSDDTIQVARDLVTWLEAARFFNQLGMEERANKAFQLASSLTPSMEPRRGMTSQETKTRFASLLHEENTLSSLLAHYDANVEKHQETTNEDCHVVPPRNDNYSTLAPFASALGYKTAVIAPPQPLKGPVRKRNDGPVIAKEPTATAAISALGAGTRGMFLRRNEAIFNCLFPHKSRQTSGRTLVTPKRKHLTIIAQSIGGKRHGH
jgi:hypothetical protein